MSKYEIDELIKLWELEKIQPEQVIGQLLLHAKELGERVGKLERQDVTQSKVTQSAIERIAGDQ